MNNNYFSYTIKKMIIIGAIALLVPMQSLISGQQVYAVWISDADAGHKYGPEVQIPNFDTVFHVPNIQGVEGDERTFSGQIMRFDLNDAVNDLKNPTPDPSSESSMPWFIYFNKSLNPAQLELYIKDTQSFGNRAKFPYQGILDNNKLLIPHQVTIHQGTNNAVTYNVYSLKTLTEKDATALYNKYTKSTK